MALHLQMIAAVGCNPGAGEGDGDPTYYDGETLPRPSGESGQGREYRPGAGDPPQ